MEISRKSGQMRSIPRGQFYGKMSKFGDCRRDVTFKITGPPPTQLGFRFDPAGGSS